MSSAISTGLFGIPGGQTGGRSTVPEYSETSCTCSGYRNGLCSRLDIACAYGGVSDVLRTILGVTVSAVEQNEGILIDECLI